jgi:hypothetical protein
MLRLQRPARIVRDRYAEGNTNNEMPSLWTLPFLQKGFSSQLETDQSQQRSSLWQRTLIIYYKNQNFLKIKAPQLRGALLAQNQPLYSQEFPCGNCQDNNHANWPRGWSSDRSILCRKKNLPTLMENAELFRTSVLNEAKETLESETKRLRNQIERCNLYYQPAIKTKTLWVALASLMISSLAFLLTILKALNLL